MEAWTVMTVIQMEKTGTCKTMLIFFNGKKQQNSVYEQKLQKNLKNKRNKNNFTEIQTIMSFFGTNIFYCTKEPVEINL